MRLCFLAWLATFACWFSLNSSSPVIAADEQATPVEQLRLADGFQAELLHSVPKDQGSWVAMTVDNRGRLIASDQYGKLYRITVPDGGGPIAIETLNVEIGMAQGLLYAFDSLYVNVNGDKPKPAGLYRLQDTDGDDQFDKITSLVKLNFGAEHGPHAVVLGPDGKSIYLCAGNNTFLPKPAPSESRVPRIWNEDHLLGRMPDARGHNADRLAPGGFILRLSPDGSEQEIICTGFRNEYDIAFNPDGELFSYDADMEWDIGTPWYRPTRVCHVVSGAEFGWRNGTGKWPAYYPDSVPAAVDIGPGSPTGIAFGTGAKFPAKYQRALFIADWSYGIIYAVHLEPNGASYTGTFEKFITGVPLPVTDIIVRPQDGAMYFTIGGRRTQSGLYRVTYTGEESTSPAEKIEASSEVAKLRDARHKLESFHGEPQTGAIEAAWPYLGHEDRFLRFAARIAVEHQPLKQWQSKALSEQDPRALITAMVALARVAGAQHPDEAGARELQSKIVEALGRVDWQSLDEQGRLELLRAYGLAFTRLGVPSAEIKKTVAERFAPLFPSQSQFVDRELCQLLVYVEAPGVVAKTLDLLDKAPTQEQQIHYAFCLRGLESGWTLDQRRRYFNWFNQAAAHRGGMSFGGFLANIRNAAIQTLSADEKAALAETLAAPPEKIDPAEAIQREFVQKWTVDELLPHVDDQLTGRNFERGREIFGAALCFKC
ncbi:MAG: heme-binding protein, partial [Planctomycetales bacterium]|nr:heme-binding protein [Planctomycetales bacterium]